MEGAAALPFWNPSLLFLHAVAAPANSPSTPMMMSLSQLLYLVRSRVTQGLSLHYQFLSQDESIFFLGIQPSPPPSTDIPFANGFITGPPFP